jgi:hypothetical protein
MSFLAIYVAAMLCKQATARVASHLFELFEFGVVNAWFFRHPVPRLTLCGRRKATKEIVELGVGV